MSRRLQQARIQQARKARKNQEKQVRPVQTNPQQVGRSFLGLITKCRDEFFIEDFCSYYLSQGVDKIFVIDDNSDDKSIYDNINDERIEIIYEKEILKNDYANQLYGKVQSNFQWMIYCDVDEFITTKKNVKNTIKDELKTTFKDVDCVMIPWVMMSCNSIEKNPRNILLENTYRWNHDKKHPHNVQKFRCRYYAIEMKSIFKTDKFNYMGDHVPSKHVSQVVACDSINRTKQLISKSFQMDPHFYNFREKHIENGFLLCYHYRIISKENCMKKMKCNAWYKKFTIDDLMSCDYPEIIDETLKYKCLKIDLPPPREIIDLPSPPGPPRPSPPGPPRPLINEREIYFYMRGHIRNSFNTNRLKKFVELLKIRFPNIKFVFQTWKNQECGNGQSWRKIRENNNIISKSSFENYFQDDDVTKTCLIIDEKSIELFGTSIGPVCQSKAPKKGWKNMWFGIYKGIENLDITPDKTLVSFRYDFFDLHSLEYEEIIKFINFNIDNNHIHFLFHGICCDNIMIGRFDKMKALIEKFHFRLDEILMKYAHETIRHQELLVPLEAGLLKFAELKEN